MKKLLIGTVLVLAVFISGCTKTSNENSTTVEITPKTNSTNTDVGSNPATETNTEYDIINPDIVNTATVSPVPETIPVNLNVNTNTAPVINSAPDSVNTNVNTSTTVNTNSEIDPVNTNTSVDTALETSPDISCASDSDCWCRIFDGTKFLDRSSSAQGLCCTEDNLGETFPCSFPESKVDHCGVCVYY